MSKGQLSNINRYRNMNLEDKEKYKEKMREYMRNRRKKMKELCTQK